MYKQQAVVCRTNVTPVDTTRIPTGSLDPVEGTAYDFLEPRPIGERIQAVTGPPPVGYDINYVLWGRDKESIISQTVNCSALSECVPSCHAMYEFSRQHV